MKNYSISPTAMEDIEIIFSYIANNNPVAAAKQNNAFIKAIEMLGTHPLVGSIKPDFTERPVRFWPVGRYLVVYRASMPVEILRILSAYRDVPTLI